MQKEVEATYLDVNKESVRADLTRLGYRLKTPEHLMRRKTFDFERVAPGVRKWGRVREEADKVTMTIKEAKGSGINDTFELEMTVSDFDTAVRMFEECNVPAKAFQESYREVWERDGVLVMIDTWPGLKPFVEVEASDEAAVRAASEELGFSFDAAVFGSIDLVYEKELGIPASDVVRIPEITFANPPKANNGTSNS